MTYSRVRPAGQWIDETSSTTYVDAHGATQDGRVTAAEFEQFDQAILDLKTVVPTNRLALYPLIPVASRAAPYYPSVSQLSDGTINGGTSRLIHQACCSFHSLRLVYGNWINSAGEVDDASGMGDITVGAAVEIANSGHPIPVTFNGALRVTIKPGCLAVSDPVGGVTVSKAAFFETRTFVQVEDDVKFPLGSDTTSSANGEGHNYAHPVGADLTGTGGGIVTTVNLTRVYGPCGLLGRPTHQPAATVAIVGDSIAAGVGDSGGGFTDWGWVKRMLGNNYPFQSLAFPGETLGGWTNNGGQFRYRRARLVELGSFSHIICQLGVNSLTLGTSALETAYMNVWNFLAGYGVPVYQSTITPWTTSSDSWATTGNQTVTVNESVRTAANDFIRSIPAPLTGILDVADAAETSRNSGIWKIVGGAWTGDGIHPSALGHAGISGSFIAPNYFGAAAT